MTYELCIACPVFSPKHERCRDMQVVIEKLQAGAQNAQAVACKLEAPHTSAHSEEALVSPYAFHIVIQRGALLSLLSFDQMLCVSIFPSGRLQLKSYPLCLVVTVLHTRKSMGQFPPSLAS